MAHGRSFRGLFAVIGLTLGFAVCAPAKAQFMSGTYPVIVVPPPPAQSMVMPKPPKVRQPQPIDLPADASETHPLTCRYQGQTKICN